MTNIIPISPRNSGENAPPDGASTAGSTKYAIQNLSGRSVQPRTAHPAMPSVASELFEIMRTDPSTHAAVEKILLAIRTREAEAQRRAPCTSCGCSGACVTSTETSPEPQQESSK